MPYEINIITYRRKKTQHNLAVKILFERSEFILTRFLATFHRMEK